MITLENENLFSVTMRMSMCMHMRESVCVLTYITAQGGIGFGVFDLGQVLG